MKSVPASAWSHTGNDAGRLGCTGENFVVFEPGANVELNVARHFRVSAGIVYRLAMAGSGQGPSSLGMSGAVVGMALVVGRF